MNDTDIPGALAAQDSYPSAPDPPPDWAMGALAAQQQYRPLGNDPWTNTMSARDAAQQAPPGPSPVLYRTASPLANITQADIDRGMDLGMAFSGGGLTTKGIKAYHGSPHDFEKFDISKIGTGEGAQAYGHGLYFAGHEPVAASYREALTRDADRMLEGGGRLPQWVASSMASRNPTAIEDMRKTFAQRIAEAEAEAKTSIQPWLYPGKIQGLKDIAQSIEDYAGGAQLKPAGHMYEVNINADPAQLLDWDKPLAAQPQAARDALILPPQAARLNETLTAKGYPEMTGGQAYTEVRAGSPDSPGGRPSQAWLSNRLREAGVPGIRYLDQGSRGLQDAAEIQRQIDRVQATLVKDPGNAAARDLLGTYQKQLADARKATSNYVMFDPSLIDILRKYGIAGAIPTGLGALAAQDQYQSQ